MKKKRKLTTVALFLVFCLNSCGKSPVPQEVSHVYEEVASENRSGEKAMQDLEVENIQEENSHSALLESFLIYLNHQAWYYPADFSQEAYTCVYSLYQENPSDQVSEMGDFWLEIPSIQGTEWYHCNRNRQGYVFLPDKVPSKDMILIQSGVLEVPEVMLPVYETTSWKTEQIEQIAKGLEQQCMKLFGWEMGLGVQVEVLLSEFDLATGCMPLIYFKCGEVIYQYTGSLLHDDFWMGNSCNITFSYYYGSDIPIKKVMSAEETARICQTTVMQAEFANKCNIQTDNLQEEICYEKISAPVSGELLEREIESGKGMEMDFDGDGEREQLYIHGQKIYINGVEQKVRVGNDEAAAQKYWIVDIEETDSKVNFIFPYENGEYLAVYEGELVPLAFFEGNRLSTACFEGNGRFEIKDLQINSPICYRADVFFCLTEEGTCDLLGEWIWLREPCYFELVSEIRVEKEGMQGVEIVLPQRLQLLATDGMETMLLETEDGIQLRLSREEITSGTLRFEQEVWLP